MLEAIVANLDDARAAAAGGADRFEMCSALALGGLTPSLGTVQAIKREIDIPMMCMVRPREGGMAYLDGEFTAMLRDAELLLEAGADGIVFGLLKPDSSLDVGRCREFLKVVERAAGGKTVQTCFHRAFDVIDDPDSSLEKLIDLGVTRILTSGREPTVMEGLDEIRRYVEIADGRIEVLPGGGIDASTVARVVEATGVDQVHLYITRVERDLSASRNPAVYFGAHVPENEVEFRVVDEPEVRKVRQILDN